MVNKTNTEEQFEREKGFFFFLDKEYGRERERILVLEDDFEVRRGFSKYSEEQFFCPNVWTPEHTRDSAIQEIESILRNIPFRAIILDGDLGLNLRDGYYCDGDYFARRLFEGDYGTKNEYRLGQKMPIYNISSGFEIAPAVRRFGKSPDPILREVILFEETPTKYKNEGAGWTTRRGWGG